MDMGGLWRPVGPRVYMLYTQFQALLQAGGFSVAFLVTGAHHQGSGRPHAVIEAVLRRQTAQSVCLTPGGLRRRIRSTPKA